MRLLSQFNYWIQSSRWDRYLGMTAPMTQVPVPTAIKVRTYSENANISEKKLS